ncbi:MAG TPA: FAD binding domain-containing protein [Actinomycetota bacterium]
MDYLAPRSLDEALAIRAERPDAVCVHGGTDVMVDVNFGRLRPGAMLDLSRVEELAGWARTDGDVRLGAGATYARIRAELAHELPGLALASRTVGSPQIRNRGTVGGNLGSASPAGDAHPPLLAAGATVEAASVRGRRTIAIEDFFVGPKRHALEPDELIVAVTQPIARGPQAFAKVGTRNAMVIAVVSFAIALDVGARTVGTGIGSAAPTPIRAPDAEAFAAGALDWDGRRPLEPEALVRFGDLVAAAARPIDDVRGTAAYRRHVLAVLARRVLRRAWDEHTSGAGAP